MRNVIFILISFSFSFSAFGALMASDNDTDTPVADGFSMVSPAFAAVACVSDDPIALKHVS